MTAWLAAVTIDCSDPLLVARFWSAALARPLDPGASSDFASIGMPGRRDAAGWSRAADDELTWLFPRVPEPKRAKNRVHVDLAAPDVATEVARLVELGATHVADVDEWGYRWTVLRDPEGNELCVAAQRGGPPQAGTAS